MKGYDKRIAGPIFRSSFPTRDSRLEIEVPILGTQLRVMWYVREFNGHVVLVY